MKTIALAILCACVVGCQNMPPLTFSVGFETKDGTAINASVTKPAGQGKEPIALE